MYHTLSDTNDRCTHCLLKLLVLLTNSTQLFAYLIDYYNLCICMLIIIDSLSIDKKKTANTFTRFQCQITFTFKPYASDIVFF